MITINNNNIVLKECFLTKLIEIRIMFAIILYSRKFEECELKIFIA